MTALWAMFDDFAESFDSFLEAQEVDEYDTPYNRELKYSNNNVQLYDANTSNININSNSNSNKIAVKDARQPINQMYNSLNDRGNNIARTEERIDRLATQSNEHATLSRKLTDKVSEQSHQQKAALGGCFWF